MQILAASAQKMEIKTVSINASSTSTVVPRMLAAVSTALVGNPNASANSEARASIAEASLARTVVHRARIDAYAIAAIARKRIEKRPNPELMEMRNGTRSKEA